MGAGGRVRGELVEGERVPAAGQARVRRRLPGVRLHRERGGQRRQEAVGERVLRRYGGGGGGLGPLPCGVRGVAVAQVLQEFALAPAAQEQQDERIGVQEPGHLVAERRHVLAGPAVVGAGAAGVQVVRRREQRDPGGGRRVGQGVRHLLGEQRGKVAGAGGDRVEEDVPVGVGEGAQPQFGAVGPGAAAVHVGDDAAGGDGDRGDMPAVRVRTAAGEPRRVHREGFQRRHPGPAPPAVRERLVVAGRPRGYRLEGPPQVVGARPGPGDGPGSAGGGGGLRAGAHDGLRRETRSARSRSLSSVSAVSPAPSTASARARLATSISPIRSSTVPSAISRCTWTGWVWPMR